VEDLRAGLRGAMSPAPGGTGAIDCVVSTEVNSYASMRMLSQWILDGERLDVCKYLFFRFRETPSVKILTVRNDGVTIKADNPAAVKKAVAEARRETDKPVFRVKTVNVPDWTGGKPPAVRGDEPL